MDPIYRIHLGVTGHRSLENEEKLREKIQQVLKSEILELFYRKMSISNDDDRSPEIIIDKKSLEILNDIPTTHIVYSILTPLAEGADRLVAETVLGLNKQTTIEVSFPLASHNPKSRITFNPSTIEVVLPLTINDYKRTFNDQEDEQFDILYDKAKRVVNLRKYDLEDDPELLIDGDESTLEEKKRKSMSSAFRKAGQYVVNHCDVLIALWDGQEERGEGGTKEIIDYAIGKNRPVIVISTLSPHLIQVEPGYGLNAEALK